MARRCAHGFLLTPGAICPLCRADQEGEDGGDRAWWTAERVYALTKLYERGVTLAEIAERLHTSYKAVDSKITRMREERRLPPRILTRRSAIVESE